MEFKDLTENVNSSECTYDNTTERETRLSGLYDTLEIEKIPTEARCVKDSSKAIQYVKICKISAIVIVICSLLASVVTLVVVFVPKESLESPECKEISCGLPDIPRNASVVAIDGTTFDKSVSFQCLEGFVLKGSRISKCQSDGTWSEYPACIDECTSSPCNTGSCIDGINKFTCSCPAALLTDCYEIKQDNANAKSGVYRVQPSNTSQYLDVFCDMETNGGGWTVFQNRFDGSVDFNRNFESYTNGFGNLTAEFWLGLKYIQEMTRKYKTELRLDVSSVDGRKGYETFQNFNIGDTNKYILTFSNVSGTMGDDPHSGLRHNLNCAFSTFDQDNDESPFYHCGERYKSGWWFKACVTSDLNGPYVTPGTPGSYAMTYPSLTGNSYIALKTSKMMFRRV